MKTCIPLIFMLALLSCFHGGNSKAEGRIKQIVRKEDRYFKKCFLFNDSSYVFTLTTIDTSDSYDMDKPTALVNLYHLSSDKIDTLISDSLFCRNSMVEDAELFIEFEDFNFDGIEDILLPAGTDPRSNHGYHLYLIDNKAKSLKYITGFNEIGNPEVDSVNRLITSCVLSGQNFCKFYVINQKDELIDLEHQITFSLDENDSLKYNKAISEILKERGK